MTDSPRLTIGKPWFTEDDVREICKAHERNVGTHPVWPLAEQLLATMQREANLREALEEIVICVWADNFKNGDAKLDAIDKRAEQALSSEYRDNDDT